MNVFILNKYIKFIFFSFLLFGFICNCTERFSFVDPVENESMVWCAQSKKIKINETKEFIEDIINNYRSFLRKKVDKNFYSHFNFSDSNGIYARIIFSKASECAFFLGKDNQDKLIYDCARYPVQMVLFSGIGTNKSFAKTNLEYDELLQKYEELPCLLSMSDSNSMYWLGSLTYNSPHPKVVKFKNNTVIGISDFRFELSYKGTFIQSLTISPIAFFTGEQDFSFALNYFESLGKKPAEEIAEYLVTKEMEKLIIESDLFKLSQVEPKLVPYVKDILLKKEKRDKSKNISDYPHWRFLNDVKNLKNKARFEFGINDDFIDALLKQDALKPSVGRLVFSYSSDIGFLIQWCFLNLIILIIIFLLSANKSKKRFKVLIIPHQDGILYSIVSGVNGYILAIKPNTLEIYTTILPGLLALASVIVVYKLSKKINNKNV